MAIQDDHRRTALAQWVATRLSMATADPEPASEDASFRRYFRVCRGKSESYIVMDAPPEMEPVDDFVRIARRLGRIGLNAPRIVDFDAARGLVLMSDLGTTTYLAALDEDTVDELYGDALDALVRLQRGGRDHPDFLPEADRSLWLAQLNLFPEWYIGRHLGRSLSEADRHRLANAFDTLVGNIEAQPRVWVHMDFHSRNLMVTRDNNPGILDFQDAVRGPLAYDAVSLLRDCYIRWPRPRVERWALEFHQRLRDAGLDTGGTDERFLRWFDLTGVQRHLKVLGVFSRLFHRDGKAGYLADLPLVHRYALEVVEGYPELAPLAGMLRAMPPPEAA